MPKRKVLKKPKKTVLEKYLTARHRATCTYWEFSGDRHCSCGRDEAHYQYERLLFKAGVTPKQKEMTMKVIMIGGYPGSGKSTIMQGVIASLEQKGQTFKKINFGIVKAMSSKDYVILGSYEAGEKFPGTDRFPMNVQPKACEYLIEVQQMTPNKVILFEGDRLFNDKMIEFFKLYKFDIVICLVQVQRGLLEQRRDARSQQNESWRKGRESKVDRMALIYPISHYLKNNTKEEQEQSIKRLIAEAEGAIAPVKNETKIKHLWK